MFCVLRGAYRSSYYIHQYNKQINRSSYQPIQATLPSDVTKALGKGCTLVGAVTPSGPTDPRFGIVAAVQPMFCPTAMVGTTPASFWGPPAPPQCGSDLVPQKFNGPIINAVAGIDSSEKCCDACSNEPKCVRWVLGASPVASINRLEPDLRVFL